MNKKITITCRQKSGDQLEAHPIYVNDQLLMFDVASKDILWSNFVSPIQPRGPVRHYGSSFNLLDDDGIAVEESNRREVLVCHDMMGNYREDRHYNSSMKWDEYRFYHWPGIDYFCYFSHNYITIPPSGWINAAHLHGVPVLGTFIAEGHTGRKNLMGILDSSDMMERVTDALVHLCKFFCFEGWLINIECALDLNYISVLMNFVRTLTVKVMQKIPNGVVIWYDSIIETGDLQWQNEINDKNVNFFKACNGILINYSWGDKSLIKTAQAVQREGRRLRDVFFGIDVFARGQIAKFRSHETLGRIVAHNFSVGIFAPGWTFETLRNYDYNIDNLEGDQRVNDAFLGRNEKFWSLLWANLATHTYSQLPFYTDFCLGSGRYTFEFGKETNMKFFNLSRQSLQPSVPIYEFAERCYDCGVSGGSSLQIIRHNKLFRLFATNFAVETSLIFAFAYKVESRTDQIDCVLKVTSHETKKTIYVVCGDYYEHRIEEGRIHPVPMSSGDFSTVTRILQHKHVPLRIPFQLRNGWTVRYFGVNFNKPMTVHDIGVVFRKSDLLDLGRGYLGAVYLHSVDISDSSWLSIYIA